MSSSVLVIRRACPADADHIVQVINSVAAEGYWLLADNYVPTPAWERALHTPAIHDNHLLLVPEANTRIVGWCRLFPTSEPQSHSADMGIGVVKHLRRQGIGSALVLRACEWAKAQGHKKLILDAFTTNYPAINLFLKMDFHITGKRPQRISRGERTIELVQMAKYL